MFSLYNTQAVVFSDGVINLVNGLFYPNGGEPNQIILQNTSGQLAMWQMSGATIIDAGSVGNPGPTWHVEGTGHFFFGDGNTDVLWQNDDGTVYVWSVDGMDARTGSVIANPGPTWHVKGDGHFFGTVYSDVLLQNDDGSVAVWGMSGPTINDAGLLGNPGPTWHVKGTGDFFGSDSSGIVMQNDDGSVALWDVSGTRIINAGLLNGPEPAWHVKGTGDFFGDSNTDVVMQNDDGSVVLWDVSGTKIVNAGLVGDPGPAWHVKGTGDYFGDGHADLVMQNDDGSVVVWDMSGAHIINAGLVGNPGASWGVYRRQYAVHLQRGGQRDLSSNASHAGRVCVHQLRGRCTHDQRVQPGAGHDRVEQDAFRVLRRCAGSDLGDFRCDNDQSRPQWFSAAAGGRARIAARQRLRFHVSQVDPPQSGDQVSPLPFQILWVPGGVGAGAGVPPSQVCFSAYQIIGIIGGNAQAAMMQTSNVNVNLAKSSNA